MFASRSRFPLHVAALSSAIVLAACGGGDDVVSTGTIAAAVPAPPADPGFVDSAPIPSAPAFVDNVATNQRGDARYATLSTNAAVRVLSRFLDLWQPATMLVDAGVSAPANGAFPAISPSTCSGLPNSGVSCGTILNDAVLSANVQYVINATTARTPQQADAAYYDDRRGKGYSVTDGMGPLTAAWRTAAQQTTSITSVPADATTVLYNDSGNNVGVGSSSGNASFGKVVDLLNEMGNNASTEPSKRFFKYARPYRWSTSVVVAPTLVPAESTTPATDGGFISGHTAEAVRDATTMAWLVPERFQEMISRGLELGENRILAGMHSPLDVIGGRMLALAVSAANLTAYASDAQAAYTQAHQTLQQLTGTSATTFSAFAHSGTTATDRFADYSTNQAAFLRRMTFGFGAIESTNAPPVVPKGAEILLQTRFPYLSADQRRVVLKTTELPSGYPVMDDAEGWGRLNLFAAADGYGAFNGNVIVSMDASQGGLNAADLWRNDVAGAGKLTLQGSGTLTLAGNNSYTGGTQVSGGTLAAASATAFGKGDVYVGSGGGVQIAANAPVTIATRYTQLDNTTLELDIDGNGGGRLRVGGPLTVTGGTLHVKFVNGYTPKAGDTIALIDGAAAAAKFSTVTVDGFKATPVYTATGVSITLSAA
ncbi:MAG: phosphatase PAP2 family protein [Burkholderia contaminans]|uniref:Phosphatase PAP2 family protein n=1 Tax=Burkholderia contaminans TaxID=488447 RepID=A0AAP4R3B0_9BURK|nr:MULTISPECIES: phosphatase PAP2 family protein [Burkholderia]MBD1410693.1 phosphatase PAP2 family protein [Burkholderia contaminans]MBH9669395.1 phosphatase PAP2 family protein [Burkholderia contaminans]MBH9676379.1 phosphatase PAP2 family protein [Burkholderia contaminans]MBH9706803.1 phosphatase PAP2 family protein [Burkholderia contaminans]MBM6425927.1 phosphatase PAP2 family protein [Burkholderia contaminans]